MYPSGSVVMFTLCAVLTSVSSIGLAGSICIGGSSACNDLPPLQPPVIPVLNPGPIMAIGPEFSIQSSLLVTPPPGRSEESSWTASVTDYIGQSGFSITTSPDWWSCRYEVSCQFGTVTTLNASALELPVQVNTLLPGRIVLSNVQSAATPDDTSLVINIHPDEIQPTPGTRYDVARRLLLTQQWSIPVDTGNPSEAARVTLNGSLMSQAPMFLFLEPDPHLYTVFVRQASIRAAVRLIANGQVISEHETFIELTLNDQGNFSGIEMLPLSQTTPYSPGTLAILVLSFVAEVTIDHDVQVTVTDSSLVGGSSPVVVDSPLVVIEPAPKTEADFTPPSEARSNGSGSIYLIELVVMIFWLTVFAASSKCTGIIRTSPRTKR